jgi:soluble lytic murein transglycosylase-like protein
MAAVKKRALDMLLIAFAAGAATFTFAPAAHADYAVLKTGVRLHITGYEQTGNQVRLTVTGGTVDVAAADLVSIEPEDQFTAPPTTLAATKGPYGNLIRAAAEKHGVDEKLITHVIAVESNFNPRATSHKQAQGLMQLLPTTAAKYSVSNIFDPAENIDAGTHYLKDLLSRYSGNLSLALAAYNAGPETVTRYGGVPPFPETQKYVQKITTILAHEKLQTPGN